jgi:hypothetical protein
VWAGSSDNSALLRWQSDGVCRLDLPLVYVYDIHGSAGNDVWFVGETFAVHYDGVQFQQTPLPQPPVDSVIDAVWSQGPGNAWAAGDLGVLHWDGAQWTATGHSGAGAIWEDRTHGLWFGGYGQVTRLGPAGWSTEALPGSAQQVVSLSGTTPDDVWAVTNALSSGFITGSALWHRDATGWAQVPIQQSSGQIQVVRAASATDVWVGGEHGIQQWNGMAWGDRSSASTYDVGGIWLGANAVWTYGFSHSLLRQPH